MEKSCSEMTKLRLRRLLSFDFFVSHVALTKVHISSNPGLSSCSEPRYLTVNVLLDSGMSDFSDLRNFIQVITNDFMKLYELKV